jgi:hypothetical protein
MTEAQALASWLLDDIGCEVEKEHFKGGKNADATPCAVAKTHKAENPDYYPKSKKPKGWKEKLVWVKEARPPYRRDPKTDPHLPHTTVLRDRDDLQIPPAAQKVIDDQWPEVVRTFAQYDQGAGMLMLYGCVRDATRAAGWPDNMAYLMRDYLIGKMNKAKVTTYTGSDERRGEFKKFHMKPQKYEAQQVVTNLLDSSPDEAARRSQERMAKLRARRPDLVRAGRI